MALSAAVGSFNTGTGAPGATVSVGSLGFQPKVVFFWWSGRTGTTDASGRADAKPGFGCAVSATDRRRANTLSQDTPTSMVTNRAQDDTEAVALNTTADGVDGLLDLQSMDVGGFTMVVDDTFTADYRVHYLAIGGDDLTNVEGGNFPKATATGDQDVTSVSFQPDLVLFFSVGGTNYSGTVAGDARLTIGAIDSAGGQAVYVGGSNDGSANAQAVSYCTDAECLALLSAAINSIDARATFVSMLDNGFRINWAEQTSATAEIISYVALKGGSYKVGSLLTQTDTSTTIPVTGLASQPSAALFLSHGMAESTADTPQDDYVWSCGAFSSTSARAAMGTADDDAAGTAVTSTMVEHDEVYAHLNPADGTVAGLMDVQSVESTGFTCIMDDADPSQAFVWYIAFGPTPVAGGQAPYMTLRTRWWGP